MGGTPITRRRITGRDIRRTVLWLAARDGDLCCLCGTPIRLDLPGTHLLGPTVEHRVPMRLGGTDHPENLALAHSTCNKSRGARPPHQLGATSRAW